MSDHHAHQAVIEELVSSGLLQPQPRKFGVMTFSLLVPSVIQTIGLCCFGAVAFSLTEMSSLPPEYRTALVVAGSFAAAVGGDIGSLPSALEIFRKRRTGQIGWPDWVTLIVSGLASLVETVIALSFLGGFDIVENAWRVAALGGLTVLDTYFTISELGDWFGSYELRMEAWREEYKEAVKQIYAVPEQQSGEQLVEPPVEQNQRNKTGTGELPHFDMDDLPKVEMPSKNGAGYCWCGEECSNRQAYAAHVQHHHYPEITEYESGVQAWQEMYKKYAKMIPGATWDYPTLEWFNRVKSNND